MHLPLTDRLLCPRCGPPFGLILLAERVADRRVISGTLGCPNCRDGFPVTEGFADLRSPPRGELPPPPPLPAPDPAWTDRVAALVGVAEGPGEVLLAGPVVAHAAGLADRVPELEVIALGPSLREDPEREGVSRMVARPGLPFRAGSLRGVVLEGPAADALLEEASRVVAPAGRVVLLDAPAGARARLTVTGLRVLVEEGATLVAERRGPWRGEEGRRLPVV